MCPLLPRSTVLYLYYYKISFFKLLKNRTSRPLASRLEILAVRLSVVENSCEAKMTHQSMNHRSVGVSAPMSASYFLATTRWA